MNCLPSLLPLLSSRRHTKLTVPDCLRNLMSMDSPFVCNLNFGCFFLVNLSHVNLTTRPTRRPLKGGGKFFLPNICLPSPGASNRKFLYWRAENCKDTFLLFDTVLSTLYSYLFSLCHFPNPGHPQPHKTAVNLFCGTPCLHFVSSILNN